MGNKYAEPGIDDFEPVYATLHFYYNDPDSMARYRRCVDAERVKFAIQEFDSWLRDQIKHHDQPLDAVRAKLYAAFDRRALTVWD